MDEALRKPASIGIGNLSPAQLATLARNGGPNDAESFIQGHKQHIERELEVAPVPIQTIPRWMALKTIQDDINSYRQPKGDCRFRKTFDNGIGRFSSQPLSQLEKLSISELSVPQHHEGKYLFCRVISRIKQMVSCLFLVDDPSGDCIVVGVYHFVTNPSLFGPSLDSQLPVGTKIAIREPYVKTSGGGEGPPFVRVDSPTDIVVFEDDDSHCEGITWRYDGGLRRTQANKSAEDYKALGNTAFQRKDYYSALAAYQHAFQASGAQKIHGALYSNISATCLHLSKPGRAYRSAKAALATNLDEPNLVAKALFRQASAAYQLRCFNEAESLFKHGLSVARSDAKTRGLAKEFDECLTRTSQRLQEQATGSYNFEVMVSDVVAGGPNVRIDVADFVGPVEIRVSHSGSRGLYVTRDVEVGELLFVNKAISATSRVEPEIKDVTLIAFNLASKRSRNITQVLNTTRLIHLCIDNPAFYSTICRLYDGNPPLLPSQPPLSMVDAEKQVLDQLGVMENVDVGRLERVIAFNSFRDPPFRPCIDSINPTETGSSAKEERYSSLFYLSSFCNHSCVPSGQRTLFGNVMVVRAVSPLSRGDEITLGYAWPDVDVDKREETLMCSFGFRCDCWYCREEKLDGDAARKRRANLVDIEVSKAMALVRQVIGNAQNGNYSAALFSAAFKAMEDVKGKVEATYHPHRGSLRPEIAYVWRGFSDLYGTKEIRNSIESEKRALVAFGAVIADEALIKKRKRSNSKPTLMLSRLPQMLIDGDVHSMLAIAAKHKMLGELTLQRNWVATAVWAHDLLIGGGLPVLKKRCPEYLKHIL